MAGEPIALIGYHDQENLGLGYLAAVLKNAGYTVSVLDYRDGKERIRERLAELDPLLVGLSVIFQFHTPQVAELAAFLEANGLTCVICAGGHYPSLSPDAFLSHTPAVDCVVRFEGETTLLELVCRVSAGEDWRGVESIAFRGNNETVVTRLRPLIDDLDSLPWPVRSSVWHHCLGVRTAAILGSRGCPRSCSFCSIRQFYGAPPGPLRRVRSPESIVTEMRALYDQHDARIFLFQDDDFYLTGAAGRAWAARFADEMESSELADEIMWKISCRTDELEEQTLVRLQQVGLRDVYLGIESGNESGLKVLNKRTSVATNRHAVALLKRLRLRYEYGFMLFDPSSTFDTVLENVAFLRAIGGPGAAPIPFGKMVPYAGTEIERQLREEGRLIGDDLRPDYYFTSVRVQRWFGFLSVVLHPWGFGSHCVLWHLRWARFELTVLRRFFGNQEAADDLARELDQWTATYNDAYLTIVEESARAFQRSKSRTRILSSLESRARRLRWRLESRIPQGRHRCLVQAGVPRELIAGLECVPEAALVADDSSPLTLAVAHD